MPTYIVDAARLIALRIRQYVPHRHTLSAAAGPSTDVIVLPGASAAEGIAKGSGATFYAGDLFRGDIFRGNLQRGTAELFIDAPAGRMAVGMFADIRHDLLFVAGGPGAAYVYDTRSGAPVASYQLGDPVSSFINDVVVTRQGAWFTDSLQHNLYFVPLNESVQPGPSNTLPLSSPAADLSGEFNLNGITATANGKTPDRCALRHWRPIQSIQKPAPAPSSPVSTCPVSTGFCLRPEGCGPSEVVRTPSPASNSPLTSPPAWSRN